MYIHTVCILTYLSNKTRILNFYNLSHFDYSKITAQCTSEDLAVSLLLQHRINDGRVYVEVVKACARHVQWEKALLVNETRWDIAWN